MRFSHVGALVVTVVVLIGCGHTRNKADRNAEAAERAVLGEALVHVRPEEYEVLRWGQSEATIRRRIIDRSGNDCSDAVNDLRLVVPEGFEERPVPKPGCTIGQFTLGNDYIGNRSGQRCVIQAQRLDAPRPKEGLSGVTIIAQCGVNLKV